MDRNEAIKRIKAALKRRSGKAWIVTGGRGTTWGWIKINAPPSRRTWGHRLNPNRPDWPENYEEYFIGCDSLDGLNHGSNMPPYERAELGRLLGFDGPAHIDGENIPAGRDYWTEFVDRAEGRTPSVIGEQHLD